MAQICDYDDLVLRPASFRGAPFHVTTDSTATGRRIVSHLFPKRDLPYHEDMGRKHNVYKVQGYVYGPTAELAKETVLAACSTYGPALLVLPQSAPILAVCTSVSASRSLDKIGWFTLDMEFQEDLGLTGGLFSSFYYVGLIATLFTSLVEISDREYQENHDTSLQTVNVIDDAITRTEDIAASVIASVESSPISDTQAAQECHREATSLLINAKTYAAPYRATNTSVPTTGRADTIPVVGKCLGLLSNALSEDEAARVFGELKTFEASAPVVQVRAPSDKVNNRNEDRLVGAFRRMALVKWAEAIAGKKYETRAEAIQARADIAESFYDAILLADYNDELASVLRQARDYAVESINSTITNLAPVLTITTTTPMSALYWSYRVQGDLEQAERIAERNGAVDWMNIGGSFTVESRS